MFRIFGGSDEESKIVSPECVASWATDFNVLIGDKYGLRTFVLKKLSKCIWDQYLRLNAPDAVNIKGNTREKIEIHMKYPSPSLFKEAEAEVYALMRFDCYTRFLQSDLYRNSMEAALQSKPLPIFVDNFPEVASVIAVSTCVTAVGASSSATSTTSSQERCSRTVASTTSNELSVPFQGRNFLATRYRSKSREKKHKKFVRKVVSAKYEAQSTTQDFNETSSDDNTATPPRRSFFGYKKDMDAIWNRLQNRMDDQRGMELNCDMPQFLLH